MTDKLKQKVSSLNFDISRDSAHSDDKATPYNIALTSARAASDKHASDITVQDVSELTSETDYFVSVTARNDRQVYAITSEVVDEVRKQCALKPHHCESADNAWQLIDFGSVIVHVFQPTSRERYKLEELWREAPVVDVRELEGFDDVQYSQRVEEIIDNAKLGV